MRLLVLAVLLLVATPSPEVCEALNVTVSPGPKAQYVVGDNATLFCHVSQKRRKENLLAVRWVFAFPPAEEHLMIKMTKYGAVQYYGNYTRNVYRKRLRLLEERYRTLYTLFILDLQQADQGHYICKVQEIGKHRNKWTAWSNGSASTEIQVISSQVSDDSTLEKNHKAWRFFEDLYVIAVFVCSIGIVSLLLFSVVILCQTMINRKRSHAPVSSAFSKPKLLKPQRKILLPRIAEENLTYAELELIKPHQEAKGIPTMTVYAQILFEENKM
uniref:V-set and transmembrane domain-containing protein 4 isoform X4 n=1 Tax=Pogona vitticeps TaxID=103695 RepID=A0ABM5FZY8_9SAUR